MKKYSLIILCFLILILCVSACTFQQNKQKAPTIRYERKLEKYLPSNSKSANRGDVVDLSEGPKLKYDAKFGPKDLNFDIKVVNPY